MFRGIHVTPIYEHDHSRGWVVGLVEYRSTAILLNDREWKHIEEVRDLINVLNNTTLE